MNRGPALGSRPAGLSFVEKAQAAWDEAPDWVLVLAEFCDRHGLAGAEPKLGYSKSAISTAIAGKYGGDMKRFEEMVRIGLMSEAVECPVLGTIGRERCLAEQKTPFRATSSQRVRLHQACRSGCPFSTHTKSKVPHE